MNGEYVCAVHSKKCRKVILSPERDVSIETFLKIVSASRRMSADYCYEIQADCYIYLLQKYSISEVYREQLDRGTIHHLFGCYASLYCHEEKAFEEAKQVHQDIFNIEYP